MDEAGFLQAMREAPDDHELRLVYADWLDDQGDPRAEFIRLVERQRETFERLGVMVSKLDREWLATLFPGLFSAFVRSPTIGTFYDRAEPGVAPYVRVGEFVDEDTIVGVVEAMKVFNEIPAGMSGIVGEILVENQAVVEYNQRLIRIVPQFPEKPEP